MIDLAERGIAILLVLWLANSRSLGADEPKPVAAAPMELPGIHNAFRVTGRIYSGSQPQGEAAFAELERLGVRTIISVDGGKPDVEMARKYGLRYVHLPFGYDGIPAQRTAQLAQAATTIPGPIFLHCHHGRHRGPAAVGIVCAASEGWKPDRAEAWLKEAGTGPDYPGLYRDVREFKSLSAEQLAGLGPLPEVTKTEALVDAMVAIDEHFDALKAMQKAGWKTPPGKAARSPADEATLLWEQFRELARLEDTARRVPDYRAKLAESERAADALRKALEVSTQDHAAAEAAFKQTSQSCAACHKAFRNERK